MAFDEKLNNRIREKLMHLPNVVEKYMFGGVCYMVNDKMCVGIIKDAMMCRIDPNIYEQALEKPGCEIMQFTGKPMKGYVLINDEGMRNEADFDYWIQQCLDFNKFAKASKKRQKSNSL